MLLHDGPVLVVKCPTAGHECTCAGPCASYTWLAPKFCLFALQPWLCTAARGRCKRQFAAAESAEQGTHLAKSCRATRIDLDAGLAALAIEPRPKAHIFLDLGAATLTGVLVLAHLAASKADEQQLPVLARLAPFRPKRVTAGEPLLK